MRILRKSKIFWPVILILVQAGCNGASYNLPSTTQAPSSSNGTVTITIPNSAIGKGPLAYGANPLHVPLGSKVVWANSDFPTHTATSDTGLWDTGNLVQNASSPAVPFNTAGTFPYHCTIHGAASMSGTIIVP